jgi:hypothetical protein
VSFLRTDCTPDLEIDLGRSNTTTPLEEVVLVELLAIGGKGQLDQSSSRHLALEVVENLKSHLVNLTISRIQNICMTRRRHLIAGGRGWWRRWAT